MHAKYKPKVTRSSFLCLRPLPLAKVTQSQFLNMYTFRNRHSRLFYIRLVAFNCVSHTLHIKYPDTYTCIELRNKRRIKHKPLYFKVNTSLSLSIPETCKLFDSNEKIPIQAIIYGFETILHVIIEIYFF